MDPAELAAFEEHLAGCETCQREVAEFAETTAQLALLSEEAPPAELRGSVLAAIGEVRQLPAEVARRAGGPGADGGRTGGPAREGADDRKPDEVPDELAGTSIVRTPRRRPRVVLAGRRGGDGADPLALGGWAYGLVQHRNQQEVVAGTSAITRLLSAPDVRTYPVEVAGTPATFVVSKTLNQAMFVGADLPAAEPGRTYQLWTIASAVVPNVTFAGGPDTTQFMTGDIASAAGLAISSEPAGGSKTPTDVLGQAEAVLLTLRLVGGTWHAVRCA